MFNCPICKACIAQISLLRVHVKRHEVAGELKAPIVCGQTRCFKHFDSYRTWSRHVKATHSSISEAYAVTDNMRYGESSNVTKATVNQSEASDNGSDAEIIENDDVQWMEAMIGMDDSSDFLLKIGAQKAANMLSNSATTFSTTLKAISGCNSMTEALMDSIKTQFTHFLRKNAPSALPESVLFLESLDKIARPLEALDSDSKLMHYFIKNMELVMPETGVLAVRQEIDKFGKMKQVKDTFQYVSILKTLKTVLSIPELLDKLLSPPIPANNFMSEFNDGKLFQEHPIFSDPAKWPVVAIELYYDDIEPANPLGSKSTIHKIGVFYYTIKNLPSCLTANMANIHLLALIYTNDLKYRNGFDAVFDRFVREIEELEDLGIEVDYRGALKRIYGSLALVSGDNLGRHSMFGFAESFKANYFCEHCMIDQSGLEPSRRKGNIPVRDKKMYENQLKMLAEKPGDRTVAATGLKHRCSLNRLRYWHTTMNKCGDLMHDFLSGVGPYIVKLVLSRISSELSHFTLERINRRISNFPYGPTDTKNKPTELTDIRSDGDHMKKDLKQKAMQFWALFRLLPLIVGDLIPRNHPIWDYYLELRQIADLLFSQKWTKTNVEHYEELYTSHLERFSYLFPEHSIIPKQHFLEHYGLFCLMSGPPYKKMVASEQMKSNFLS